MPRDESNRPLSSPHFIGPDCWRILCWGEGHLDNPSQAYWNGMWYHSDYLKILAWVWIDPSGVTPFLTAGQPRTPPHSSYFFMLTASFLVFSPTDSRVYEMLLLMFVGSRRTDPGAAHILFFGGSVLSVRPFDQITHHRTTYLRACEEK